MSDFEIVDMNVGGVEFMCGVLVQKNIAVSKYTLLVSGNHRGYNWQ
jgi:hypothetical protein